MNKTKERTCISCGEKTKKELLLRWINIRGQVAPDWTQKLDGRSVYTHFKLDCIEGLFSSKKLPSKFADKPVNFIIEKEKMSEFIYGQAKKSLSLFFSLSIKSGKIIKGQNLVVESVKKGKKLKYCFCASDLSDKTYSGIVKALTVPIKKIKMDKAELGSMIDGRPCGVVAFVESELSDKVYFYMDLVENFISGDINAHR